MRICLVHEEYPEETNFGGIATYQKNLAMSYVEMGHKVIVISKSLENDKFYIEDGIEIYRIAPNKLSSELLENINYKKKIEQKILEIETEIDVIESPEWGGELIFYLKNPKRKIPVVIKLHTPLIIWSKYNKFTLGKELHKFLLYSEKEVIKLADSVMSCSNILKEKVISSMELEDVSIKVVPNPANCKDFYKIENIDKEFVLFCGSLEMRKGVHILAHAIPMVLSKYPNLKFYFVGKDTVRNEENISMKKYIYNLIPEDFHDNIYFLGHIENKKLNLIYNKAFFSVFPSLFDNFPYVVLESMAAGTPIIGSLNSGIIEMVEHKISGLLCPINSPEILSENICDLFSDLKLRDRISKESLTLIKKYAPNEIAKKNLEIYRDTIISFFKKD